MTSSSPQWHVVAGFIGGFAPEIVLYPLDLIKNRRQVQEGARSNLPHHYHNLRHGFRTIVADHGYAGLYRGITASLFAEGLAWGLYFSVYNQCKHRLKTRDQVTDLRPTQHMGCAATAGVTTVLCTNPMWVTKMRLQLQTHRVGSADVVPYRGAMDCLTRIVREEGFTALYRGLTPALTLVSHGAIQFMLYEELRRRVVLAKQQQQQQQQQQQHERAQARDERRVRGWEFMACGSIAKVVASTITYPLQVIKARLYQSGQSEASAYSQHLHRTVDSEMEKLTRRRRVGAKFHSMRHVITHTYRLEGIRGFYKGLLIQLSKTGPAAGLTFGVYEIAMRYLAPSSTDD